MPAFTYPRDNDHGTFNFNFVDQVNVSWIGPDPPGNGDITILMWLLVNSHYTVGQFV
jgi:hypothetical protein